MSRCRYCQIQGYLGMVHSAKGYRCKSQRACFERMAKKFELLRAKLNSMRSAGDQMSNICFNLAQRGSEVPSVETRKLMDEARRLWDTCRSLPE